MGERPSGAPEDAAPAAPAAPAPVRVEMFMEQEPPRGFIAPDVTKLNDRKMELAKKNPLVLVGTGVTCFVLARGLVAMRRGDSRTSQLMMRGRVAAQGFTVAVLAASAAYVSYREKQATAAPEAEIAEEKA
ncbi:Respiratory supercomplex factor 1, mitochondrial [Porphyridium purpureum]|uniref:Respiratory supercomplex factor 1, mitochondrial n=1 Tax=Porphyridium purpureum TaxID=35688 RepID=A0A5J4Z1Z0_PORPP|nr:Respiratory supercomplex factor 1, mitochondrial [Porphyridium purpureum]|eukprot:POR5494..scf295_1